MGTSYVTSYQGAPSVDYSNISDTEFYQLTKVAKAIYKICFSLHNHRVTGVRLYIFLVECQVPQAFHLMVFSIYWQSFIDESEFAILLVLHAGDFFCLIALTCKRTDIRSILFSPSAFPYWHMVFDIVYIMADVYCAWSYD
jgi:hypothetical protein